jgi:hypothetical protein
LKAFSCDKCGVPIDGPGVPRFSVTVRRHDPGVSTDWHADLCMSCRLDFHSWLSRPPEGKGPLEMIRDRLDAPAWDAKRAAGGPN